MKAKFFLLISLVTMSSFIACGQTAADKAIRELLEGQVKSWNRADIDTFMQAYWNSDSLKFVGKSGITYGYANTLNNYKKNYNGPAAMGKLSFDILQLQQLSGEYSFVTGKWFLARQGGNIGGYFTLLFRKIEGKWLIICDHTS